MYVSSLGAWVVVLFLWRGSSTWLTLKGISLLFAGGLSLDSSGNFLLPNDGVILDDIIEDESTEVWRLGENNLNIYFSKHNTKIG